MKVHRLLVALIVSALVAALPVAPANAATEVRGRIREDTTWTKAGSPYQMLGDVIVDRGVTLTIEPGVRVEAVHTVLMAHGSIRAIGTAEEPITFTGLDDVWDGIVLKRTSRSEFVHTDISSAFEGIKADLSVPRIESSTFHDNHFALELISPREPIAITGNVFIRNDIAVTGRAGGPVTFSQNDFWNNNVNFVAGPRRVYDCVRDDGDWQVHNNDILRGPRNAEFYSFDMRTPPGSADFDYRVNARNNWWGTTDEDKIAGRFRPEITCCPGPNTQPIGWRPPSESPWTPWEPTGPVPDPEDPRSGLHGDPAYYLTITAPDHGDCIPRGELRAVRGRAGPALMMPPERVKVALRRQGRDGDCKWWSRRRDRLVAGTCKEARWITIRSGRGDDSRGWDFALPLPETVRRGRYTAFVGHPRAHDGAVRRCYDPGRGCVRFRITR